MLNTAINVITDMLPFLMLYSVHPRTVFNTAPAENPNAEAFFKDRQQIREEVMSCLKLMQAKIAHYFNQNYILIKLVNRVWLHLVKGVEYRY